MINIFGDNRQTGPIGPSGPAGKDAFNFIRWAPDATVRLFRESEDINIYFDSVDDAVIKEHGQKVAILNHGRGPRAELIDNFPDIHKTGKGKYFMALRNSLFKISPILTAVMSPSIAIFGISFKPLKTSKEWRTIFSNEGSTRAVSIQERDGKGYLKIHSNGVSKELQFDGANWSILIVQYSVIDDIVSCQYKFNAEIGSLSDAKTDGRMDNSLYIGGHPNLNRAECGIGSFEMYYGWVEEDDKEYVLSNEMRNCIFNNIKRRVKPE